MGPTASETPWAVLVLAWSVSLPRAATDPLDLGDGIGTGMQRTGDTLVAVEPRLAPDQDQVTTVISGMRLRTSGCGVAQEGPSR